MFGRVKISYLGSDIPVSAGCESEVNTRLGRAWGVMTSLDHGVWRCRYLCRMMKVRVFRSSVLPVLLYGCETWTLIRDLRRRLNSFGVGSLQRILGYCWSDFVSNKRLLRETQVRFVTCIVYEHQLWLYGHVARFPDADPAHQILSAREPCEWRKANRLTTCLMVAADRLVSQGDGDGQTENPGVSAESGRRDAWLRCLLTYLT